MTRDSEFNLELGGRAFPALWSSWQSALTLTTPSGEHTVTISWPRIWSVGVVSFSTQSMEELEELQHVQAAFALVEQIKTAVDEEAAARLEEERKREEERRAAYLREAEERRARQRAEREAAVEKAKGRSEQLLNELADETGRIRLSGMKRWRPVTVEVVQLRDGYRPIFRYRYRKHGVMEANLTKVRAFEVKVGSRFKSVWNDGDEDLREWDRSEKTAGVDASYDAHLEAL